MIDSNIILQNPQLVAILIASLLGNCYFVVIIRKFGNIYRKYSLMQKERVSIMDDKVIRIDDEALLPFAKDTIDFMDEIESVFHLIIGWIINSPKAGWIKGYTPQIQSIAEATITELEKQQATQNNVVIDPILNATLTNQPAQPVSTATGA